MRKGRRQFWLLAGIVLFGTPLPAAPAEAKADGAHVRLTVEVDWSTPPLPTPFLTPPPEPPPAELEVPEGRVIEVIAWPGGESEAPGPKAGSPWSLGSGHSGRVRARVEAPIGGSLIVRAGGQAVRFPILAILEGPQQTPAQAPARIGVERLAWDTLEIAPADGLGDGTLEPGATVPMTVGLNVLTPEPTEVALRLSAELRPARGGEPLWRADRRDLVVATDALPIPTRPLVVTVPKAEGTYLLEVRATWEAAEGTRLGRWLRRRRGPASATRRVVLTVVGAKPAGPPAPTGDADAVVDAFDLARLRGSRPSASGRAPAAGSGRAPWTVPEAALVAVHLRDRLRGWIARIEPEAATLGAADASGLAWSALGLRVPHPGRPHRLSLTVVGGHPSALGIALVAPGGAAGGRPRVVLDACASAPPILDGGAPATFSWLIWPDAPEPVLVLVNRGADAPVRLGSVELKELADVPAPLALIEPAGASPRALGLLLAGPQALDRFGGAGVDGGPDDTLALARNLAGYLAHCGASMAILPDGLADRARRLALDGQAGEDATGPDRLDLILRILGRRGLSAWVEARCDGPLPGLPAPESAEALARGLVRVDRLGRADGPAPAYFPLHPEVRKAMARHVAAAIAPRRSRPNLAGVMIRLGPGSTLPGGPEAGPDDATFARFARAMFDPEVARGIRGLGPDAPDRFAARAEFLAGAGRLPWLTWRAREVGALYDELAAAARRAAPGAVLAVATPGLDDGPAGREARRTDGAGLPPGQAWRAVGLDLRAWPAGPGAPIVLRGVGLADAELGPDLATSPDLDDQVAARPARGLLLADPEPAPADDGRALRLAAAPMADGPAGDEPLGHALAALDVRWAVLSAAAVAGQEERVRHFARVFRALPAPAEAGPPGGRLPSGVAIRSTTAGGRSYFTMANDTPYPIVLEAVLEAPADAAVDDVGRDLRLTPDPVAGGKRLVLDLPPFGSAAIRIAAPGARETAVTLHHPAATLAGLEAQAGDLSARLARLARGGAAPAGPANPGCEPESDVRVVQIGATAPPRGWRAVGDPSNTAEIDASRPRSGLGSLRLDARALPAAVVSDPFAPPGGSDLVLRACLRSDRPDGRVRVRVEGEAGGQPITRSADVAAPTDWAAVSLHLTDLPPSGLRRARLRLEPLAPGRLWVDDVSLSGDALPEADRSNARRTLGAALQAYREHRYADFARLANSRWARRVEPAPGPNAARPDPHRRRF